MKHIRKGCVYYQIRKERGPRQVIAEPCAKNISAVNLTFQYITQPTASESVGIR